LVIAVISALPSWVIASRLCLSLSIVVLQQFRHATILRWTPPEFLLQDCSPISIITSKNFHHAAILKQTPYFLLILHMPQRMVLNIIIYTLDSPRGYYMTLQFQRCGKWTNLTDLEYSKGSNSVCTYSASNALLY